MERYIFDSRPHGSGGFAKVFKGRDNELDRAVAVKVLDSMAKLPEPERERFKREARILARLCHPNVPAVYDVLFTADKFQIYFQFIEGKSLKEILEEEKTCQLNEVRTWFHQICSALEHAHAAGIVHRDIKPSNIVVTSNRESAYLVDFGIALSSADAKRLTKSEYVIGTPGYMSPEQESGEELDRRTDIYSLGVTLYETLAGKRIPVGQYELLTSVNQTIPTAVDDLIQDCLKQKQARIQTAREFDTRLSGALRTQKPLSDILAHGQLHELASYIEDITAQGFIALPEGQRALILAKVVGVLETGDEKLSNACERFLELLISRGLYLPAEDYRELVSYSIDWGFERDFGGGLGRDSLRLAIEQAAFLAPADAHRIIREEFTKFLKRAKLDDKEPWYLHRVRQVLQTLLANPACSEGAKELADHVRKINKLQQAKQRRSGRFSGA